MSTSTQLQLLALFRSSQCNQTERSMRSRWLFQQKCVDDICYSFIISDENLVQLIYCWQMMMMRRGLGCRTGCQLRQRRNFQSGEFMEIDAGRLVSLKQVAFSRGYLDTFSDNKDFRRGQVFGWPAMCDNTLLPPVKLKPRKTNLNIQQVIKSMENLVPMES